jgi:hypothetical protein
MQIVTLMLLYRSVVIVKKFVFKHYLELRTTYHGASDYISYLERMTTITNAFGV